MDVGFYLLFVPIVLVLIPSERLVDGDPRFFLLLMLYLAVIHFINRQYNFLTYMLNGNYGRGTLFAGLILLITYLFTLINVDDLRDLNDRISPKDIKQFRTRLLLTVYFIDTSFSVMMALVLELFRQKIGRQEIEAEKNRAEISLYKSQINPHFMFNTLNTLYGLYITKSDKTGEVFIKFTNLIKYMYSNAEREKIAIAEEIEYIHEYIELQTLRLGGQTTVNFTSTIDNDTLLIPPMILITFVENAFKYGVSSTTASNIDIVVEVARGYLTFSTRNEVFPRQEKSTGIGIANCRKRLELLYRNKYTLACTEEGKQFTTHLKIAL